jgi:tetratricopeptide (TPR) repeat protein
MSVRTEPQPKPRPNAPRGASLRRGAQGTDLPPRRGRASLRRRLFWTLFVAASAAAGTWGVLAGPGYREWRYSRMLLPALMKEPGDRMKDPVRLYYLGRRLNDEQRFGEADPLLRQAVELDGDSARIRDEWARALLGSGMPSIAYGELRQFVDSHPNSADAHFLVGRFYVTQHSMERAREALERSLSLQKDRAEAWAYLAGARDELRDLEGALSAARRAVALRPSDSGYRLMLADFLTRTSRTQEAGKEYARAVELAPESGLAHRAYAEWLLSSHGDAARAEAEARQALAHDPKDARAYLLAGRARALQGNPKGALGELEQAAALDPHDPAAPLEISQAYHRLGDAPRAEKWRRTYAARQQLAESIRVLGAEINAHPKDPKLHRRMARLLARRGDVDGCLRQHASALRATLDATRTLIAAAEDLSAEGHAAEALPLARRAVSLANANPAAHEALGNAFLGVGQFHLAGRHYNKAAGWIPQRTPILRARMQRYMAKRAANPPPAERLFRRAQRLEHQMVGPKRVTPEVDELARKAVELEPHNPIYLNYLLKLQMAQRESAEALETADRLLELVPEDARTHANRAVLILEQPPAKQDLEAVEADLKAAAGDRPVAGTYHYARGLLALQRKDAAGAVREFRRTLEVDPETDVTYYKLFLAERLAGNEKAAERAMAAFKERQEQKRQQAAVLGDIAQHPNDPELYRRAVSVFRRYGLLAQADAIQAEATRRFGARGAGARTAASR